MAQVGLMATSTITFRENTTAPIPYNASASDVELLEELDVINYVNVDRSDASSINGYTWTVELVMLTMRRKGY